MTDSDVSYEPTNVKAVLGEMKDIAELLIDLSFSSVLFEDPDLAEEVLALEAEMDVLEMRAWMALVLAGRNPDDAERLAPVFAVVAGMETISDAAGDVAKVVRDEVGLPAALRASLPAAVETLARAEVAADSTYVDRTLGDLNLETETGVRVIALRRGEDWVLDPDRETTVRADDVVVCRGTETGVAGVYERLTGDPYERPAAPEPELEDLDRAVETLVLMKNLSELAVDLAHGSVVFDSPALAEEVEALEVEVDALQDRFEAWALRAAADVDDPITIRGLLHIAASTEVISDAAADVASGVRRGIEVHPVVQAAVEDSDEVFVRTTVGAGSDLAGETLGDVALRSTTGMHVVAIRRAGDDEAEWLLSPDAGTRLQPGDNLLAKGTRSGAERLESLASGG